MSRTLLLPRARVAPGGALCTSRQRPGGRLGLDGVLRAKATVGATREPDGQGAVVRICNGDVFVTKEEAGGGRGVSGVGSAELSESPHAVRVSPSAPGGFQGVVRGGGESSAGLARFGKLSVDGTKVRANASKRKAMSYGVRGGAGLEGGGVAEHGCGGGRTLWRVVARGRVARGVAPSRGPVGGGVDLFLPNSLFLLSASSGVRRFVRGPSRHARRSDRINALSVRTF